MTVVLHKFGAAFGVPDISPFCIKLETYLRMAKVPFSTNVADARKAPKGKLPYIEHDGRQIADSHFAIEYLKERFGDPLDEGMTPRERALCQAVRSMVEEHLYFVGLYGRWQQDAGWSFYLPTLREYGTRLGMPGPLQPLVLKLVRRKVIQALHGQGMGRHTPEEVTAIGKRLLDALSELLGEGPYFCGERLRSIDATLFAFLTAFLVAPFESEVRSYGRSKRNLVDYVERIRSEFYREPATASVSPGLADAPSAA